jgi:hypothetical protein
VYDKDSQSSNRLLPNTVEGSGKHGGSPYYYCTFYAPFYALFYGISPYRRSAP